MHVRSAPRNPSSARPLPGRPAVDEMSARFDASNRLCREVGISGYVDDPVSEGGVSVARVSTGGEMDVAVDGLASADEAGARDWNLRYLGLPDAGRVRSTSSDLAYVARLRDAPVGLLLVHVGTDVDLGHHRPTFTYAVRTDLVYVAPPARGQGVGRLMVRALRAQAHRDLDAIVRRLAALRFGGSLRVVAEGMARTEGGAALLGAIAADLSAGVAACDAPFPVSCVSRA